MIRNAKRNFEKRLAGENGNISCPFYAYIERKTKSRPGIGPLKNEKKEAITDDQGMAELLNNFFGSVFTREELRTSQWRRKWRAGAWITSPLRRRQ